jgi:hypothetical protein
MSKVKFKPSRYDNIFWEGLQVLHDIEYDIEQVCDTCDSQEGRHYCLLHGKVMKNMDISKCNDWRVPVNDKVVNQKRNNK